MTAKDRNTTGKIREALVNALDKAINGDLPSEDGRNIIGLANQISQSMAVECKVQEMKVRLGHQSDTFGSLIVN